MQPRSDAPDFDRPVDRAGTWSTRWERYAGRDVIPLWVADTDFRAPDAVLSALAERIEHGVLGYTAAPDELREAIVERLQRLYGWRIEPGWIVFLPGIVSALHHAARCLVPADGHALVPTPIYQHFKLALTLAPRAHTDLPLVLESGRWVFDLDFLAKSIRGNTKLLFLCNPQNPGGTVFRRDELLRIAGLTRDLLIVSDEIHCDLILDEGRKHVPVASLAPEISRRTVTLMSPSKTFNTPGVACAWAIIEDENLRRTFSVDLNAHVLPSPSVFGYIAALASYRGGDAWLEAQIAYLRANRDQVEAKLALPMAHVEASYLAWIDCSPLGLENAFEFFLKNGVALSPGSQFGDKRFVRLNFGTQRARLGAALERMSGAVQALKAFL